MEGVPGCLLLTLGTGGGNGVSCVQTIQTPGYIDAHSEPAPELSFESLKSGILYQVEKYSRVNMVSVLIPRL